MTPVAGEIVVDTTAGTVTIDGVQLPGCVAGRWEVEHLAGGLPGLTVTLTAEKITVIGAP